VLVRVGPGITLTEHRILDPFSTDGRGVEQQALRRLMPAPPRCRTPGGPIPMLRSSNPILSKQDAFTPAAPQQGQNPYAQQPGYGQPPVNTEPRMTFDDVITKTAVVMGLLVVSAALAWMLIPDALYMPA